MKKIVFSFIALLGLVSGASAQATGITVPTNTGLPDPSGGIQAIIWNFIDWLLTTFLILAVLAFVITGLMYLFALGDARSQTLDNAKNYFQYAIIAVLIVGSSYIIIQTIDWFLGAVL